MVNEYKSYRDKELKYFTLLNLSVVFLLNNSLKDLSNSLIPILQLSLTGSCLYLCVFIFDSLIPVSIKDKTLLYFRTRWKCHFFQMPGEYIFSKLKEGSNDIRSNKNRITKHYKHIYAKMPQNDLTRRAFENDNWFKLYRKHENKERIRTSQKEYLLCRDMMANFCLFVIVYIILFSIQIVSLSFSIFFYFLLMYCILLFCSRNKANRYVINVIIEDLYEDNNENLDKIE